MNSVPLFQDHYRNVSSPYGTQKNAFEKVCKKHIHIMVICVVDEICLFSRKETWGMF